MLKKNKTRKKLGNKRWKSKKRKRVLRGGEGDETIIDGTMICPKDEITHIKKKNNSTNLTLNKSTHIYELKKEYYKFLNKITDYIIKNIVDKLIDEQTNKEIVDEIYEKWMYQNYDQDIYKKFKDFLNQKITFDDRCYNFIENNIVFIINILGRNVSDNIYKNKDNFINKYKSNKDTLKTDAFNLVIKQFSSLMANFQNKIYTNLKITNENMVNNTSCSKLMTNDVKNILNCPDKLNCLNPNCYFIHPKGFIRACRYGEKCRNRNCTFKHPEKSNKNKTDTHKNTHGKGKNKKKR